MAKSALYNIEKLYNAGDGVFFLWLFSNVSEVKYKTTDGEGIKILTPKQMLQKLPMAHAHVKTGNKSENLLNKIRQIIYSSYRSSEITKKVYSNK